MPLGVESLPCNHCLRDMKYNGKQKVHITTIPWHPTSAKYVGAPGMYQALPSIWGYDRELEAYAVQSQKVNDSEVITLIANGK